MTKTKRSGTGTMPLQSKLTQLGVPKGCLETKRNLLVWKGNTHDCEDHDCFISIDPDTRLVRDFVVRVDLRDRTKAVTFLRGICDVCRQNGLTLVIRKCYRDPREAEVDLLEPDVHSVVSYLQSTNRVCLLSLWGTISPEFAGNIEFTALTYNQYVANEGDFWFDPVGASAINYRCGAANDGYLAWWRFVISEADCDRLVHEIGTRFRFKEIPNWTRGTDNKMICLPEGSVPSWWARNENSPSKSIRWIHEPPGQQEQLRWQFIYDHGSGELYGQLTSRSTRSSA